MVILGQEVFGLGSTKKLWGGLGVMDLLNQQMMVVFVEQSLALPDLLSIT